MKKRFLWDASLSTGDPQLDRQHKALFSFVNELSDAIDDGVDKPSIAKIVESLSLYAGWHFAHEEDCMARYRCPTAAKNKSAHAAFINKIDAYKREFHGLSGSQNHLMNFSTRLHADLSDWIQSHIVAVDTKLSSCINSEKTE